MSPRPDLRKPLPLPPTTLKGGRRDLHAALLEQVTAHQDTTPCLAQPGGLDWLDPRPEQQQQAAEMCGSCQALAACKSYIAGHPREPGTWAGTTEHDREQRSATMRAAAARRATA